MKVLLAQEGPSRVFAVIFEVGDEVIEGVTSFAQQNGVQSAHFTGIGAFSSATLGWFNAQTKQYEQRPIDSQVEVASLVGNISQYNGQPRIHAHVVVGTPDGIGHAGHLFQGIVRPTLELFVTEVPARLERRDNPQVGMATIAVG